MQLHRPEAVFLSAIATLGLTATSIAQSNIQTNQPFVGVKPEQQSYLFRTLGVRATQTKFVDPRTGDVVADTRDALGNAVDLSDLVRREVALRRITPRAKFTPELAAAYLADPQTTHEVVVWLNYDADRIDAEWARLTKDLDEASDNDAGQVAEEAAGAFALQLVQRTNREAVGAVRALGVTVRYVSTSAPVLFVDANEREALAIEALAGVDTLYLESDDAKDTNTSAAATHRANWTFNQNWRGNGVRVAVLENNGIDPACPHLNVSGWFNRNSPNPDDHVHGTAGCIASRLATRRGHAPNVTLFSANAASYSDTNITRAADWIANTNISVTNMSFGGTGGAQRYKDRYFDYQSRTFQDSYVASAGNSGDLVGSPGSSWNCVTVGAFNDNNNGNWAGDAMSGFSASRNPNSGCQKPNVAGVGQGVDTIGMGPDWLRNGYSGTSFSAPFTAGSMAIMMSRDGTANYSPEAAMAGIMATAWHNIEGATRLSGRDGAGGLHTRAAARCANRNGIRAVTLNRNSFSRNGYYTYNISLNANDRARVAIAWGSRANAAYTTSVLDADLDIRIYRGSNQTSGTSYGSSASGANNFEIVEFTPPTSGTYTIRINDRRFRGTSERVGIAFSQRNRDLGT